MTTTMPVAPETLRWQALLPPSRGFVALPSRARPLVVAEAVAPVLEYVRTALLAAPPGAGVPWWVVSAARAALRVAPLWRLAPHVEGSRAGGLSVGGLPPAERMLVLRHSRDPDARTMVLLFGAGERWPAYAVKLAAGPCGAARVRREADTVRRIAALPLSSVRQTVPTLVALASYEGLPALATTAQPGIPMLVGYHRRGGARKPATVRADLAAASDWLASFQAETAGETAPLDVAPDLPATLARRLAGWPDQGAAVLAQLHALRQRLRRHRAPRTAVHGDFWPGNVLVRDGAVSGVVDWEWAETAGSPARDWARFVLGYSQYLDRHARPGHRVPAHPGLVAGRPGAAVAYALDGQGWYPRMAAGFLRTGLGRLGIAPACGRDAVLAELAAIAAEATDEDFAREQLHVFVRLAEDHP
jgi:hypothetical protein